MFTKHLLCTWQCSRPPGNAKVNKMWEAFLQSGRMNRWIKKMKCHRYGKGRHFNFFLRKEVCQGWVLEYSFFFSFRCSLSLVGALHILGQMLANFFSEGPESKYFRVCRPHTGSVNNNNFSSSSPSPLQPYKNRTTFQIPFAPKQTTWACEPLGRESNTKQEPALMGLMF